jgi:hypothetical protein
MLILPLDRVRYLLPSVSWILVVPRVDSRSRSLYRFLAVSRKYSLVLCRR